MSCLINISLFHWLLHQAEVSFQSRVWDMVATFLSKPAAATRETEAAYWLNDILDSIWPFLNPDIFKPLTNIMEATIQANSPPFVSGVSIEDMGQGSKPIRIVGIRRLPKQPVEEDGDAGPTSGEFYDEIMTLKPGLKSRATELSTSSKRSAARELRERLKMLRERTSVHVEVAFDYGRSERDRDDDDYRKRMHILLVFRLVGGVRVPVWINMDKIVGLLRARVQLKPDPPFVSKAVISLLRKPEVQFACLPLFKSSMNVMGMPLVSTLVQQALETALAAYISPRSINIDLGALLVGETTSQDVYPLGVIIAKMHQVHHLQPPWARDDFSSFLSVGWAKTGDPLYIYRTIYSDKSPRWEEGMAYCVGPEEVNAQDSLEVNFVRIGILDNETIIGSCKVLLTDVISSIEYSGKLQLRTDDLLCEDDGHSVAKLDWSIGFFPKASVSLEQLQRQKIYPPIKDHAEFEQRVDKIVKYKFREAPESAQDEYEREKTAFMQEAELKIMNSQPPVDQYPCGILHVEIPSMNFLSTSRAVRETDDSDEMIYDDETPDAPTSYANIYINQHRVTRTLIKPRNSDPNFGSEVWRFVRDWRTAEVIVVVRDKKRHRTDTFLGAVRINIADLFERNQSSRVQLAFPVEGGMGSGLANMTILFRALNMDPPPEQRSWDYGTLQVSMPTDSDGTLQELKHSQLTICSTLEEWKLYPNHSLNPLAKDPHQLAWFPKDKNKSTVSFPIKNKYAERITFQWGHGATKRHWSSDKVAAYSFWKIEDLIEHQEKHLRVPVYTCSVKWMDDSELWPENHAEKTPIGYVEFSVVFRRGLTEDHAREMKSKDVEEIMEVEEALGPNPLLTMRPF
ncbi:hypothetical protein M409DRAFT_36902 [Zasmidium cellare ATCC 36951]|uniref:Uncharacterized protein n=1 Tax=Zasmidium cellare ATCC 36951 TaxID=1080233 RepID=A0A6A6CDM6_ZASCE|nr:uncharacterized protein M409DRAFT_36902 [Zasmidium cellare ATCC 36951]KAF2165294.1 hypothetical protein M409DRAFT_36902 [Zasmidium cellare ATCC 36951]